MENDMNWLKASGSKGNQYDDASSAASRKGPRGPLSEEEKKASSMADALNWLRSNETDVDVAMDEASVSSFAAGPQRAKDMENAMNWLKASRP